MIPEIYFPNPFAAIQFEYMQTYNTWPCGITYSIFGFAVLKLWHFGL
jgi:hypothetical protein